MVRGKVGWRLAALAASVAAVASLVACGGGVSQADYDALKKQVDEERSKSAAFQSQLSAKVQETATLQQQATAKEQEAATAKKALADAQAQAGKLAGITPLIYAKQVPTPTPRPAPTPLPPGVPTPTPAPPVRVPAEVANEVLPFTFYVETLATSSVSKYGLASFPYCVPNAIFKRGSKLVWRFEVFDTSTGKRVTDLDGAEVKVKIPNIDDQTARYSRRGGTGPWMWAVGWDIPPDYQLGPLNYQITVKAKDGRTATFKEPFLLNAERGIDSRVQIIEEMK